MVQKYGNKANDISAQRIAGSIKRQMGGAYGAAGGAAISAIGKSIKPLAQKAASMVGPAADYVYKKVRSIK